MGIFWDDTPLHTRGQAPRIAPPLPETDWKLPTELPSLAGQGLIAIDVETFDPDLRTRGPGAGRDGYICGVAVGTQAGYRQYFPVRHQNGPNMDQAQVFGWLSEQLSTNTPKVGANLLYDLEYFAAAGVKVCGPFYDVQIAEPLLDETQLSYSLENIARRRIGEGKRHEQMNDWLIGAYGKDNIKSNIWRAPPQVVGPYAEGDVDLPLRIFADQEPHLQRENLWDLFQTEAGLVPMLLAMRQRGVRVNIDKAEALRQQVLDRQKKALAQIKSTTGIEPDIWASDSIAKLFDHLGIEYPRTEKTNAPSFRKGWLEQVTNPVAKLLVEARRLDKFRGTFLEGYILEGHVKGRLYCQFHQLRSDEGGTVSGRFSSSLPNLQNIPIRDPELGPLIRELFVPEENQDWFKMDWSQIEFRLAVHYASKLRLYGSDKVVEQYQTDPSTDYHQVTAQLTGLPRKEAKSINFGIIYGLGMEALCTSLGVDREEGETIVRQYNSKLPFVRPLYNKVMWHAREHGEIKTLSGRKRRFKMWTKNEFTADDTWAKGKTIWSEDTLREEGRFVLDKDDGGKLVGGEYRAYVHKALNALLQGSAADIMKKAMLQIWESGVVASLGAPHLTVHDELDGSLPRTPEATEALAELRNIMQTCVSLEIPLVSDQSIAPSWGHT